MLIFSWHNLLFSIKGNSATLILDCNIPVSQELRRNTTISKSGIILIGQQLDETLYLVSIFIIFLYIYILKLHFFQYRIGNNRICVKSLPELLNQSFR